MSCALSMTERMEVGYATAVVGPVCIRCRKVLVRHNTGGDRAGLGNLVWRPMARRTALDLDCGRHCPGIAVSDGCGGYYISNIRRDEILADARSRRDNRGIAFAHRQQGPLRRQEAFHRRLDRAATRH